MPGTNVHDGPVIAERLWFARAARREWLLVELADGRAIGLPLSAFPTLLRASPTERGRVRKIGGGVGFHWPALDFDVSVEGLIAGRGERKATSAKRAA